MVALTATVSQSLNDSREKDDASFKCFHFKSDIIVIIVKTNHSITDNNMYII